MPLGADLPVDSPLFKNKICAGPVFITGGARIGWAARNKVSVEAARWLPGHCCWDHPIWSMHAVATHACSPLL
jgi:hypothetical protein